VISGRLSRGFSLIELIIAIVILATITVGFSQLLRNVYIKKAQAKYITQLSLESQVIIDQIASLLEKRIHFTAIAYDPDNPVNPKYAGIDEDMTSINNPSVLEWMTDAFDSKMRNHYQDYVIDWSSAAEHLMHVSKLNISDVLSTEGVFSDINASSDFGYMSAIFIGDDQDARAKGLGWHDENITNAEDASMKLISTIVSDTITIDTAQSNITTTMREKYYLVSSAYAITTGKYIDQTLTSCPSGDVVNILKSMDSSELDNTLLLFNGHKPWKGETFCADKNGASKEGNVFILGRDVNSFQASSIDHNILVSISLSKPVRGTDINATVTKQKVVF
jgi:prepilin-type N-terminal cleavage/methylation domain-containing protein